MYFVFHTEKIHDLNGYEEMGMRERAVERLPFSILSSKGVVIRVCKKAGV